MIEFGKTLRSAREAKGYNISQLSEMTHVLPHILEQLEREDFSKIVAPIYGRGFVKLYCEAVGLETKPLVEAFMAIYNGETTDEAADDGTTRDESEPEPPSIPDPPAGEEQPVHEVPGIREPPAYELPGLGADDAPKRDYRLPTYAVSDVPGSFWRFGILIVGALLVLAGLVFVGRAIYRATMTAPETGSVDVAERVEAGDRAIPRQPVAVPPLYID